MEENTPLIENIPGIVLTRAPTLYVFVDEGHSGKLTVTFFSAHVHISPATTQEKIVIVEGNLSLQAKNSQKPR